MSHDTDPDPESKPGRGWLEGAASEKVAVVARCNQYGHVELYRVAVEKVEPEEWANE
jgi:hypothetical protein